MTKLQHKIYLFVLTSIPILAFFFLLFWGFSYYTSPLDQRFYHDLHKVLKPNGLIGHGLGIIGSLLMLFGVGIYMIRKRVKSFYRLGVLKHWLELHIFMCTLGPILVLFHTSFKFGGIVSISFWSMVAVVLSGVIGRFIYVQIPRTIQGEELSLNQLKEITDKIHDNMISNFQLTSEVINKIEEKNKVEYKLNFTIFIKEFLKGFFINYEVKNYLKKLNVSSKTIEEISKSIKQQFIINRKIKYLKTMQKYFRYWHIVHLPFAIIMLIIMIIHVIVSIVFGYTWIF
ncbi:MAG: hypothetical protein K8F60_08155 [Melioribacteraceae bacterium]|nr:hypothetical protein [Melioribacteraceae bacterium]